MSLLSDILGKIGGGLTSEGAKASSLASSPKATSGQAGVGALIDVAVNFGVGFLTKKSIDKKTEEMLKKMANLDAESAERLRKKLSESATEVAKTQVLFEFIQEEKEKELIAQRNKSRILPLIGLGVGVVLISLVFYKLKKQNG